MIKTALYQGKNLHAYQTLLANRKVIQQQTHVKLVEVNALKIFALEAQTAIAAAMEFPRRGYFSKHAQLIRSAIRFVKRLERAKLAWTLALATLLRAGVANVRCDTDKAISLLEQAITSLDAADMLMYAAAARRQRGRLLGGDEGRALIHQADEFMTSEGVVRPDRIAAMLAPGFPD